MQQNNPIARLRERTHARVILETRAPPSATTPLGAVERYAAQHGALERAFADDRRAGRTVAVERDTQRRGYTITFDDGTTELLPDHAV